MLRFDRWTMVGSIAMAACLSVRLASAETGSGSADTILKNSKFNDAAAFLELDHQRFVQELIALTEIPSPSFKEEQRGEAYLLMLRDAGLTDVEKDAEGNVMGVRVHQGLWPEAELQHSEHRFEHSDQP
jgi:hypothetical protein